MTANAEAKPQATTQTPVSNLQLAKRLLGYALPITISLGIGASVSLVDSILVAPLGASALAAIALGGSVTLVVIATLYGLMTMFGIRIAEADAKGDHDRARIEFGSGLLLAAIAGIIGACAMGLTWPLLFYAGQPTEVLDGMADYWMFSSAAILPMAAAMGYRLALEAIEKVWLGTSLASIIVICNGIFGLILIHGYFGLPALGLTGAGLASLLANCVGLVITIIVVRRNKTTENFVVGAKFKTETMLAQAREGLPAGLQYLLETGANTVAMLMVGVFGTIALAANQIVVSVAMTIYMIPLGISAATGLFVARLNGEGRADLLRPVIRIALLLVTAIMGVAALAFWLFGKEIANFFTEDNRVIASGVSLFLVFAVMQLFDGIQSVSIGALRGLHDVTTPAVLTTLCLWLMGLPMAAILSHTLLHGPQGVWAGLAIGLCAASIILLCRLWKRTNS